jgi:hypothetical protein
VGTIRTLSVARLFRPPGRTVQLLVETIKVQDDVIEVRIRAKGLASLVGELRQDERRAA